MIRVRSVHIAKYKNAMEALHKEIEGEECNILFILGITKETDLAQFPSLPATTLISTVSDPTQLGKKMKAANLIPPDEPLKVTMQLIKTNGKKIRLSSFDVQSNGTTRNTHVYTQTNPFPIGVFAENNITNSEKLPEILEKAQHYAFTGHSPQRTFDFQGPLEKKDIPEQTSDRKPTSNDITLTEKLHCVVVYDSIFKQEREVQNRWKHLQNDTFFGNNLAENSSENLTITSIHKDNIQTTLPDYLEEAGPKDKILLTIGLTSTNNLQTMPSLPYRFIAIPYSKHLMSDINTISQKKVLVDLQKNNSDIVCFTLATDRSADDAIHEYRPSTHNNMQQIYDSSSHHYQVPEDYPQQLNTKLMTVEDLTEWINAKNPDMLNYEILEQQKNHKAHNNSTPPTKAIPASNLTPEKSPELQLGGSDNTLVKKLENETNYNNEIISPAPNPSSPTPGMAPTESLIINTDQKNNLQNPPQTEMSNKTSKKSSFTTETDDKFELADTEITLVTGLMNDADYNEEIIPTENLISNQSLHEPGSYRYENELKTTIFSKTQKFVHEHPKTSVGLGTAVLTLVGTIIYKIKKLFTRESKKSQAKNQITQKYNQHVKNKI